MPRRRVTFGARLRSERDMLQFALGRGLAFCEPSAAIVAVHWRRNSSLLCRGEPVRGGDFVRGHDPKRCGLSPFPELRPSLREPRAEEEEASNRHERASDGRRRASTVARADRLENRRSLLQPLHREQDFEEHSYAQADRLLFERFRALQLRAPSRDKTMVVRWARWGLFMGLNVLAKVVVAALASNQTICLVSPQTDGRWPYHPSAAFEKEHECYSYNCYFTFSGVSMFPDGCASLMAEGVKPEQVLDFDLRGNDPFPPAKSSPSGRFKGALLHLGLQCNVSNGAIRSMTTRWIFTPTELVMDYVNRRHPNLHVEKPFPAQYVSMHIRWGDKVRGVGFEVES